MQNLDLSTAAGKVAVFEIWRSCDFDHLDLYLLLSRNGFISAASIDWSVHRAIDRGTGDTADVQIGWDSEEYIGGEGAGIKNPMHET